MNNPRRRLLTLVMAVVAVTLLASVSLAGSGSPQGQSEASVDDVVETTDDGATTDDPGDGTDEGGTGSDDPSGHGGDEVDPAREAACMEAAGIDPAEDAEEVPEDTTVDEETKAHGLENAIERLLENCIKNPQAPGLLTALERHEANRLRHEEHEAWKAERKAEREAAKDARKAERRAGTPGHGKGHGGDGGHGNPHGGGSGGSGSGHGQGSAGSHGSGQP